ncbi:MAG: hypothetical protein ABIK86_06395 [candidate division WOR-3 bacterium]
MLLALVLVVARVPEQPEFTRGTDSADMCAVSRWSRGGCDAVAVSAGYTYVGSGSSLLVFRDSLLVSNTALGGACNDMVVSEGRLYIAAGRAGVLAFDIRDPARPRRISGLRLAGWAMKVDGRENQAAVACGPDGLVLLDSRVPEQPQVVWAAMPADSVNAAALARELVLVACGSQGLVVARPEAGLQPVAWFECPSAVLDVVGKDSVAYAVCGESGMVVVNLARPESPRRIRRLDLPYARAMAISDTLAVAVSGEWGAWILNVANPGAPYVWCYLPVPGNACDVALEGNRLAVACGPDGLYQFDLSRPTFPVLVHHARLTGLTIDLAADGDTVWVCTSDGLHVVDMSRPEAQDLGFLALSARPCALALGHGFGLVSTVDSGVLSFSTTDPSRPVLLGSQKAPGRPGPIAVKDSWAFVSVAGYGIQVLNAARPESVEDVGALRGVPGARGLSLKGDFLVLAAAESGLYFCDIRQAHSPQVMQWLELPGPVNAVWYDTVTLAAGDAGLFVLDTRDVTDPRLVACVRFEAEAWDVVVADTVCFVACGQAGVVCLEALGYSQRSERPRVLGHYRTATEGSRLGRAGADVVLADLRSGLTRVRLIPGTSPKTRQTSTGPTVVRGVLHPPTTGMTNSQFPMTMFDATGRRVMELRAGPNDVRQLASGVYFLHPALGATRGASYAARVVVAR